ncbi:secreted protein/lipoprotein [Streptomyces sp. NPDC087219]|uniref:secreted protein/lipoprotein n=1 Tax=Streptomyces sp. NPDC087219 TaxID=3365770 RepID=UPI0038277552
MTPSKTETPAKPMDPVKTAKKEAIATYLSHWTEVEKRYADKTDKAGDLKKYAAVDALLKVENDAADMHRRNLVILGNVTVLNPTVVSAELDRKIPNVVISSCLDISRWTVTRTKTGQPATSLPKNRLLKYVIKATVEKWPQGWVVIRDDQQGKKC